MNGLFKSHLFFLNIAFFHFWYKKEDMKNKNKKIKGKFNENIIWL